MKKSLGQNFLIDQNILNNTIKHVPHNMPILEIGTGGGALTEKLAQAIKQPIVSYEIDLQWFEQTKARLANYANLTFVNEDILSANLEFTSDFAVVANIPYYITSPIIEMFLDNKFAKEIYIMVQKEIATRIISKPGEDDYSSLSIFCQTRADVSRLFNVSASCFHPAPKVDSSFIKLIKHSRYLARIDDSELYNKIIRSAFWGKRKTIVNSISHSPYLKVEKTDIYEVLARSNVDPKERAENISIEQFILIANNIFKL